MQQTLNSPVALSAFLREQQSGSTAEVCSFEGYQIWKSWLFPFWSNVSSRNLELQWSMPILRLLGISGRIQTLIPELHLTQRLHRNSTFRQQRVRITRSLRIMVLIPWWLNSFDHCTILNSVVWGNNFESFQIQFCGVITLLGSQIENYPGNDNRLRIVKGTGEYGSWSRVVEALHHS